MNPKSDTVSKKRKREEKIQKSVVVIEAGRSGTRG